jgi:tyrosine-protein kinase Etk/Wzc
MQPFAQSDENIELHFLQVAPDLLGEDLVISKQSNAGYLLILPDDREISGRVGERLHDPASGVTLEVNSLEGQDGREYVISQSSEEDVIRSLRENMGVSERGRNSGVLNVTFKDQDPAKASQILGSIVNAYLRQNISRDSAEAESSLRFIEERLPEARATVDQAEAELQQLQSEKETFDLSFETQILLEQQNLVEAELAALEIEEEALQRKYTVNHPTYKILLVKKGQLEDRLSLLKTKTLDLPETQQQVLDVTQQLTLARETYSKLLIRAQELRVVKASTIGNVRVIDRAKTASIPVAPRKSMTVGLGGILGLILGAGLVLIRQMTAHGIMSSSQIESQGFPVFAVINKVKNTAKNNRRKGENWPILAVEDPTDLSVEAFRGLRTSLRFGMLEKDSKVLAITSPSPGAGKSFCSVNLSTVTAQADQKVCLIDADLRRGELRKFFGRKKGEAGLAEYLTGSETLESVMKETEVEGLSFISTGKYPPNPADLLLQPAFNELMDKLSKEFDLVVVDCPPVLAVTDPVVISRAASVTLLVARHSVTTQREMDAVKREVDAAHGQISGAIYNGFEQSKSQKHGGYDYRYAYD